MPAACAAGRSISKYFKANASASSRVSDALIMAKRIPAAYIFAKSIRASLGCCHLEISTPCIRPPGPRASTAIAGSSSEISDAGFTVIVFVVE